MFCTDVKLACGSERFGGCVAMANETAEAHYLPVHLGTRKVVAGGVRSAEFRDPCPVSVGRAGGVRGHGHLAVIEDRKLVRLRRPLRRLSQVR